MKHDYYRDEIMDVLNSGPAGGPEYSFRIKVFGTINSKHLNVTADQLRVLADVMDETNPRTLLPLANGHRVLAADTWFRPDGVGEGYVIADVSGESAHEYVTWHVWQHKGETRWLSEAGVYFDTMEQALVSFNERRGVSRENGPAVYFVSWAGGYDQPSHFASFDEAAARATYDEWVADAKTDEGDWVQFTKFNPATGALSEVATT